MVAQLRGGTQRSSLALEQKDRQMDGGARRTDFAALASAGYYIALHVGYAFPLSERNALPELWVERYTQRGFMLYDPVMRWLYENKGAVRWSAIALPDPRGILQQAARFGLRYGAAIACAPMGTEGQRSFGSFARADREFDDEEIRILESRLRRMHEATAPPTNLTRAELEALSMVKDGLLLKEIANTLGVSEGAIKQRLKNAKTKLGAKTSSHAISVAVGYGLI
ncbi:Regulatory protein SdiA [Defluviimonas aquaemixtae]|uniref:Regulatory protein SdiA n=2 Tax=Albidovulum aquaemixtae TaxID=1542388 RepID=A0A2R8B488_9RHOB|nr:Regulatory protein SdiA [Defluviimonas aquaemixtae]